MRKISLTLPFILVLFATVFYVGNLFSNTENKEDIVPREWKLNSMCDIKVLNMDSDMLTYSDIQKAMLANRLKNGTLPVSIEVTMNSSQVIEGLNGAKFRFKVNGIEIENTMENVKVSEKSLCGVINCDFSKLYNGKNENELLAALKNLTSGDFKNCEIMADFKNPNLDKSLWTQVSAN